MRLATIVENGRMWLAVVRDESVLPVMGARMDQYGPGAALQMVAVLGALACHFRDGHSGSRFANRRRLGQVAGQHENGGLAGAAKVLHDRLSLGRWRGD